MLKLIKILSNRTITEEQEYTLMFMVITLNVLGRFFFNIINFKSDNFFISIGIISFFIFISFSKDIYTFIRNLDYIPFFRRLIFSSLLGLLLTELLYTPYIIKTLVYADSQPTEEFTLPITSVFIGRVGRSGIYYKFKGDIKYIGYDGKTVSDIQSRGINNFCISLKVKQGLDDMYLVQDYNIKRCNGSIYE